MRVSALILAACAAAGAAFPARAALPETTVESTIQQLIERHGAAQEERIRRGVRQVAAQWWTEDGDAEAFAQFCLARFAADPEALRAIFLRLEQALEQVDGHLLEVRRELTRPAELDTGEVQAVDQLLGEIDLQAHVTDDLYRSRVAFLALLNFPLHTLTERLKPAAEWDREAWARSRMMDRFALRIPAAVTQEGTAAFTRADQYIANYYIRMDRLVAADGKPLFREGLRLITHWGLRDEIKAQYAERDGLGRQRAIQRVMQRIVRQEIPEKVVDNPDLAWSPETLEVRAFKDGRAAGDPLVAPREPDTRYARLLDVFRAVRKADPYSPTAPTYIDRKFEREREIPEAEVQALLVSVLGSAEFRDAAGLIRKRLGRPLEPFDIWYDGFKARGTHPQAELDRIVAQRYPDRDAFQKDLPGILGRLGFAPARAEWLAEHIVVDAARGAGHALGAVRREDQAHLRTHFGPQGMDYKGYNIAIHELGHNVEQVFSLHAIDHWWLAGVPNNAFTEALAFVFQNRDLELLGLGTEAQSEALDTLWSTAEIGGVALVDMQLWHWLYRHPEATPAELREATLALARNVWNQYYAPVFGLRDVEILAIYSHMIEYGLYLPDYPLGHLIAFQVAAELRRGDFGLQFERVARQGRLTPDAWMRGAVKAPLGAGALLEASRRALDASAE
jgi:hypothetical protein